MFLPPKLTTILLGQLIALTMLTGSVDGQQADFERRMAAMQEARARAQAPVVRVASADTGADYTAPPVPPEARVTSRVATRAGVPRPTASNKRVVLGQSGAPRVARRIQAPVKNKIQTSSPAPRIARNSNMAYTPKHVRTAQLSAQSLIDGGSPIIDSVSPMMGSPVIGTSVTSAGSGCSSCSGGSIGGSYMDGGFVSDGCSTCDACSSTETIFEQDACCGRGGCPPGPCWLNGLGAAIYNGEYFGGATSFRAPLFATPGLDPTAGALSSDSSHGFYGGFNLGLPLCQLTGGVLSGQVGVRSVQTNFNGNDFTTDDRDQLFITAGFFRRVDYGLQAGVVADILHEEWFTENDLVQIRGEIGWVFGGGRNWGFRFTNNTQDDITSGTFNGNTFTDLVHTTNDNYRFFIRRERQGAGFGEVFVGWSDLDQTIVGLDFDMAVTEMVALQAGFTYFLNDEGLPPGITNTAGGNAAEAYNIFVGFVLRPRGRSYYNSYERPLFSVADNGSMSIIRTNQ